VSTFKSIYMLMSVYSSFYRIHLLSTIYRTHCIPHHITASHSLFCILVFLLVHLACPQSQPVPPQRNPPQRHI
jgi:hypothetical protein